MRLGDIDEDEIVLASEKIEEEKQEENKSNSKLHPVVKTIIEYLMVIAIGALIAVFLTQVVIVNAVVPTGSMKDTINEGDRLIGLRLTYYFDSPKRGDVVIFKCPEEGDSYNKLYVKRVIGLPGETVKISGGNIYICTDENPEGTPLPEDYLYEIPNAALSINNKSYEVPEGYYFMLGDNRNNSNDSRFWGMVEEDRILAKVMFRYYPSIQTIK